MSRSLRDEAVLGLWLTQKESNGCLETVGSVGFKSFYYFSRPG